MEKLISNSIPEMSEPSTNSGNFDQGFGQHHNEIEESEGYSALNERWIGSPRKYTMPLNLRIAVTERERQGAVEEMPVKGLMGKTIEGDLSFIENFPASR